MWRRRRVPPPTPIKPDTIDAIVADLRDNAERVMATADQLERMARRYEEKHGQG